MNLSVRFWRLLWVVPAFLAGCSEAPEDSGFAGLATVESSASVPYLQPRPGDQLRFPEDFGPHPQHRIEWWYLTANLETSEGQPLGLQWTQFRQAIEPRSANEVAPSPEQWPLEAAWMAHGAISWNGQHWFAERLARGDVGHAGARSVPFEVWLDDWQLTGQPDGNPWRLQVAGEGWSYDLELSVQGAPVRHGVDGFSAKSASGEGSMYFSLVDIAIEGRVTLAGEELAVTGQGWFDREWSSQFLKTGQQGWDWFALHLDSGDKLMAFRLREEEGAFQSGTWIPAEGKAVALRGDEFTLTPLPLEPLSPSETPTGWRLQLPGYGVDVQLGAPAGDYRNSGLFPYWESPVRVSGSHAGVGYMELTGYDQPQD